LLIWHTVVVYLIWRARNPKIAFFLNIFAHFHLKFSKISLTWVNSHWISAWVISHWFYQTWVNSYWNYFLKFEVGMNKNVREKSNFLGTVAFLVPKQLQLQTLWTLLKVYRGVGFWGEIWNLLVFFINGSHYH